MIRLTREVRFSVDRDWAGHIEPGRAVTNAWAGWPSAVGLVPYLQLRATVVGEPDPVTGYLCNITAIDRLLREHAIPFIAERLSEHGWRVSAERLLRELWDRVVPHTPTPATLTDLELLATPYLKFRVSCEDSDVVHLTQQFEFSAAHRLHCDALSAEENRRAFGKCNNPSGHGHNYVVEVTVSALPDEATGAVLPLPQFEQVVKQRAIDVLDHTHLNLDTSEFASVNPSVENIARVIFGMLSPHVSPARLSNVRVYETPKTWADYSGE